MNPILRTFFLVALFVSGIAGAQDAHVAIFKNISGSLKVIRNDSPIDATVGMPLFKSDRVVSTAGATGGIAFKDGTSITIGPSSEISIRDFAFEPAESKYAFSMYLAKGTAIYSSGKIGKVSPESVHVETPNAVVGVRGTRFIVSADEKLP